jgi:hypothetical protein
MGFKSLAPDQFVEFKNRYPRDCVLGLRVTGRSEIRWNLAANVVIRNGVRTLTIGSPAAH